MKKIMTLALAAMVACASFAQSPKATVKADKASTAVVKKSIAKDAKAMKLEKAQELQAAKAAKAEAAAKMAEATKAPKLAGKQLKEGAVVNKINHADALVDIPATAEVYDWYMAGTSVTSSAETPFKNRDAKVAIDGSDIYLGNLFQNFNGVWVKGTIDGDKVTFPVGQYLGMYAGTYDMYFIGAVVSEDGQSAELPEAVTGTIDLASGKIALDQGILANVYLDEIYYLEWYRNVEITADAASITGDPIDTLPFVANFANQADFAPFGVIDANGDGSTWSWTTLGAQYTYSSYNDGDDYLVSPAIYLEAGKAYEAIATAYAYSSSWCPEAFEIVMGKAATPEALTTVVMPEQLLYSTEADEFSGEIKVEESGYYHFAIHCTSPADMFYLVVTNFVVQNGADPKSPVAVQDLRVVPGPTGQKRATIYFTTPTVALDGTPIAEKLDVNIYHNDVLVKTIESYPGVAKTVFDDEFAGSGVTKFTIIPFRGSLKGQKSVVSEYIGFDTPNAPTNFSVAEVPEGLAFAWEKVDGEGANGGYVDPSQVAYQVWDVIDVLPPLGLYALNAPLSDEMVDVDSWTMPYDCNAGAQGEYIFAVIAMNEAGQSGGPMAAAYLGAPDAIPAHESFVGGAVHYNWYIEGGASVSATMVEEGSIDDYSIEVNVDEDGDFGGLISNKFNLAGAENATVSADLYSTAEGTEVTLFAEVGGELEAVETYTLTDEWATYKWNVAKFNDVASVRFHIVAEFPEAGSMLFDNFNVIDLYKDNLVATISAPAKVVAGNTAAITVKVQNLGENDAEGYVVKVLADDAEIISITAANTLKFYETASYAATFDTSIFDEAKDITLKAVVEYAPELKPEDNEDETTIALVAPTSAKVENLTATKTDEGVVLAWETADAVFAETTEDFEDYDEFAYVQDGENLGDWTGWDLDGGMMYGWNSSNWPYSGTLGAFGIYNPVACGFEPAELPSGEQTAMFMAVQPSSGNTTYNDDWMVSPELPGVAQTISFMVSELTNSYGDEKFEVLVSTTGNTPECFTKIADGEASMDWVEFSAELPEGAKYFAIRCISEDAFVLLIDDATFTVGAGEATSFNVYVDQVKVGSTEEKTYTVTGLAAGEHQLSVTAVYGTAESAPESVTVSADGEATAIKNIETSNAKEIYTVNGVRVSDAKKAGVYVVNGQKVIIK